MNESIDGHRNGIYKQKYWSALDKTLKQDQNMSQNAYRRPKMHPWFDSPGLVEKAWISGVSGLILPFENLSTERISRGLSFTINTGG
jgi:hypothetical protein